MGTFSPTRLGKFPETKTAGIFFLILFYQEIMSINNFLLLSKTIQVVFCELNYNKNTSNCNYAVIASLVDKIRNIRFHKKMYFQSPGQMGKQSGVVVGGISSYESYKLRK